jgi:hypothetical protein
MVKVEHRRCKKKTRNGQNNARFTRRPVVVKIVIEEEGIALGYASSHEDQTQWRRQAIFLPRLAPHVLILKLTV